MCNKFIIIILLLLFFINISYAENDNSIDFDYPASISSTKNSKFKIDNLHKGFGYATVAVSLAGIIFGGVNGYYYANNDTPPFSFRAIHKVLSHASIGLSATSFITGFIGFWKLFTYKKGINIYNSHIMLSTLYTVMLITSTALAYASGTNKNLNVNRGFSPHCGLAVGSGAFLIASIVVLQF